MDWPSVTIILPVRNEQDFIEKTLETVFAQDYPADRIEILVVDGMSDDATADIVERLTADRPNLRLLKNPRRLQSFGMNLGIGEAKGEFIIRMDGHALYGPDYVRVCVELLQRGDAIEVGGVQQAIGTDYFSRAVAIAMTHPFGVGDARFRYTDREIYADTVFLGAWKRQALLDFGGFTNEVNEEGDLNFRLREAGHRILVSPRIRLKYIVRKSLFGLMRQYAWYGRARVHTLVKYPDSILYRHLVAPLFVVSLLLSAMVYPLSWELGVVVPSVYGVSNFLISAWAGFRKGVRFIPALWIVFLTMHVSWGIGFFGGILKFGVPKISLGALWKSLRTPTYEVTPYAASSQPLRTNSESRKLPTA